MVDSLELVDHSALDWRRVTRTACLVHQRITYTYDGPVRRLRQRLLVQPREQYGGQRRITHRLEVVDARPRRVGHRLDSFGNEVIDVSVPLVEERVTFVSWSVVERHAVRGPHLVPAAELEDPRLLAPTRLTEPDATLRGIAGELRATGLQGAGLALAVCSRVHGLMSYAHDVTSVSTSAAEAAALRHGVCQDYAHVMLAICRLLGLSSRYVSGQLLGVGGSHAWVEVLLPRGRGQAEVLALDPTHDRVAGLTYLTIAVGRDYADVAPMSGTYEAPHAGFLTATKTVAVIDLVMR
jgi:transglutaminase-like putative cysteine protease